MLAAVIALLLAAIASAPLAEASTVYACVQKSGTAHIFAKKPNCKKGETKFLLNTEGLPGRAGANGINGTNGKEGAAGKEGAGGKEGTAGREGAAGSKGVTGATGPTGAAGSNGANGSNGSGTGGGGATGATGPTGAAGSNGANGMNGSNGANGSNGGSGTGSNGGGPATAFGELASGASETGGWAVTITGVTGDPQVQADGVISFPIPVHKAPELEGLPITYRNGTESGTPKTPCLGSPNEPVAEKGHLCVYRGVGGIGSEETQDKGVGGKATPTAPTVPFFEDFTGTKLTEINEGHGRLGVDIVFRTNQFEATSPALATLTETAYMVAKGSWAVTEK
jgi:hypothetical protein